MEIVIHFACDECGFDNRPLSNADLTAIIEAFPPRYAAVLRHNTAAVLRRRPSNDVWSPLEYAVHQREVVDFYAGRIELVATQDTPQLSAYGFGEAAERDDYNAQDPLEVAEQILRGGEQVAKRLATLKDADWARAGLASTPGDPPRAIRNLASRLAHEFIHHLIDIDKGLAAARS